MDLEQQIDRRVADAPELHPTSVAELVHLVDVLDAQVRARSGRSGR
ncbi:MAG TPA: hypothetical protein VGD80_35770 [Kofleriaceae bacterium]